MSAQIINLRTRRKQKSRDKKRTQADQNAAVHGRSAEQVSLSRSLQKKHDQHLDGHRIDTSSDDE